MSVWRDLAWYEERLSELCDAGDAEAAIVVAREAAESFPDSVEILLELGELQSIHEEFALARATFERAFALAPSYVDAKLGLASALVVTGQRHEAVSLATEALNHDDLQCYHYLSAGNTFAEAGELGAAMNAFALGLELEPNNDDAAARLGWIANEIGELGIAEGALVLALTLNPAHPEARIALGEVYFALGDPLRAAAEWVQVPLAAHHNPVAIKRYIFVRRELMQVEGDDLVLWERRLAELELDPIEAVIRDANALSMAGPV